MNILITGSKGQLGSELQEITKKDSIHNFIFVDKKVLDITSILELEKHFSKNRFHYCINCAAYTAVDKCEEYNILADSVNSKGPENLAKVCKKYNTILIHISTDFVFNGENNRAYIESDKPNPINIYGKSKLKGEIAIQSILQKYYIIRTSWLYSSFGNNFVKTMLRIYKNMNNINVVDDQIGTPTYARDLANVILLILNAENVNYGLYHFSNEGVASWYDFAYAILDFTNTKIKLNPIPTAEYPLPAKRPVYSVMNTQKIKNELNIVIPHWTKSLKDCLDSLIK